MAKYLTGVTEMWYSKTTLIDKESCLIYKGPCFTIEWFYDEKGYSQPYEYFLKSSAGQKRKFLLLAKKMGDFGKIIDKQKFRNEDDKIYAFKPQPDRYLCFFKTGKKIIVTNAFRKKGDKLPTQEKTTAVKTMEKYFLIHKEDKEE